jgi:hypothetical protein
MRLFKKNSTTTEYKFPVGAIVMYDQSDAPDGFFSDPLAIGYYIKGGAATNYFEQIESSHSHTFSYSSGGYNGPCQNSYDGGNCTQCNSNHTHSGMSGTTNSSDDSSWELDYVSFHFIKKAGDQGSWDGVSKYVYTLFASNGAASNGWAKISTYDSMFLKIGTSAPETGSAAGLSHSHTGTHTGTSSAAAGASAGGNGDDTAMDRSHTHEWSVTVTDGSHTNPPYRTFTLIRKVLGQMAVYNTALTSSETNGVWTSPPLELLVQTFGLLHFNLAIESGDTWSWFMRTATTQALVVAATTITTVDNTTDKFTEVGHGLSNGDRIIIDGTVIPAGLSNTIMYYVVGVSGNDFQVSLTSGGAAVDFTTNGTAVTFKKWVDERTVSGTQIDAGEVYANNWVQYICVFTAADTTVSNPRIYMSNSFVLKIVYAKQGTIAEDAVEFKYQLGRMNLNTPAMDKIFKKILLVHLGSEGGVSVLWETENASGSFSIDLTSNPEKWDSFFHDDAFGKEMDVTVYKNDIHDFLLKEIQGFYSPQPLIM